MAPYGHPTDIFEIYRSSVHGKALFEKKDLSAANCASCHGSHGAVPPGVKSIGDTCGKCHINEKKYFLESPHARALAAGKFSECISCHGNHGVAYATPALYQEACAKCHAPQSAEMDLGRRIERSLREADDAMEASQATVKQASIEGFFTEPETALLEELKTTVIEMEPIQHTLSLEKLTTLHDKAIKTSEAIRQKIDGKRKALRWRRLALVLIWLFIAVMVAALWTKYHQLKKQREKGK